MKKVIQNLKKYLILRYFGLLIVAVIFLSATFISCDRNSDNSMEFTSKEFAVSFTTGDGSSTIVQQKVKEGGKVIEPEVPTRNGYTFVAWYKEEGLKNEWRFNIDVVTANLILYAKFVTSENCNFYDLGYRIGLWVNSSREDTLKFVNSSKLIRKGFPYNEEYSYRIENNTLIISGQTHHPIMKSEKNMVVIGNMYIAPAVGFVDNSGTFIKE